MVGSCILQKCLLSVNLGVLIGSQQGEKVVGLDWQGGPGHLDDDDDARHNDDDYS